MKDEPGQSETASLTYQKLTVSVEETTSGDGCFLPRPFRALRHPVTLAGSCRAFFYLRRAEDATLGALADVLRQSTVWYFWWDR